VRVIGNFIHHIEKRDPFDSYASVTGQGAFILNQGNVVYQTWQHHIAADARATTGYHAYDNFFLSNQRNTHQVDMHPTGHVEGSVPYPEQWLLIEWPRGEAAPTKYWLSTLPAETPLKDLVRMAKQRWIIERDYEELKQELGLGHYEGRGWRGFHHHATLCIAAYGFLVAERNRFSPSARAGRLGLSIPKMPPQFHPRGSPRSPRTA